ncbi:MAG: class I SAM-dependent methyltransferase, partial [Bacteroidota bacterium]
EAIGVNHTLLHQMGNRTNEIFQTLHVYGDLEPSENVTGDARVLDLWKQKIQRVDGGVFFGLLESEIKRLEEGPNPDFPTRLRHMIELGRRIDRMDGHPEINLDEVVKDTFKPDQLASLLNFLRELEQTEGKVVANSDWRVLLWELREAAKWQRKVNQEEGSVDPYEHYAQVYDALIGSPELEQYTEKYLQFFVNNYLTDRPVAEQDLISVGCSTGLVESHLIEKLGFTSEKVYGVDLSPAMVRRARTRINADVGDVLTLDPAIRMWDVVFAGHRVYHYVNHEKLQSAIQKAVNIIQPGGYFVGEFVTPDHSRTYSNIQYSSDQQVVSLRQGELVEKEGLVYHRTQVTNVDFSQGEMAVEPCISTDQFLPPLHRVRAYFELAFQGKVDLFDAVTLKAIPESADSCSSTRYIVIAQKN